MPLFFNKVLRGKPGVPESEKKWYLILKSTGLVRTREVAKLMADETTLNPKEAEIALVQAGKIAGRLLAEGHTVELEGIGSFYLTANSQPAHTKEEVTALKLKGLNIRFNPAPELKDALKKAQLKSAESIQTGTN